MTETQPLVSIVVITYNFSKYVFETLESAKAQTYNNIKLIISDDCSTDNTVEICRRWIEENKDRFARTELITVENNTGISANGNRGLKAAKGEWIKFIAGNDLLAVDIVSARLMGFDPIKISYLRHFINTGTRLDDIVVLSKEYDTEYFLTMFLRIWILMFWMSGKKLGLIPSIYKL